MPIRPEWKHFYEGPHWQAVRERIRARANDRCEWPGCGVRDRAVGYWQGVKFVEVEIPPAEAKFRLSRAGRRYGDPADKLIRIVCTCAHVNQKPGDDRDENLAFWCQRHHLKHDQQQHNTSAYMTRKRKANTRDLF